MNYIDKNSFPYKIPTNIQKQVLLTMDKTWDKYKFYICELPTGVGKSAIAKTICSSVNNGFIITATKQLQDQYYNEFKNKDFVSIKGKKNYKCSLNLNLNCETGYCVVDKKLLLNCKQDKICKYYKTRDNALRANTVVTSYQYFFRSIEHTGPWKPRNIIVFDECHLLENQLIQWASIKLIPSELIKKYNITSNCDMDEFCRISIIPTESGYSKNQDYILTVLKLIYDTRNRKFDKIKSSLNLKSLNPEKINNEEYDLILESHKDYYELDKFYKKLESFIKSKNKEEWLIEPTENGLELTPIDISEIFSKFIEPMAIDKIVFMSASILDLPGFRKMLNLPKDETFLIKSESEFDPKKSPIIFNPVCKMNYNEINNNLEKIKNAVEEIMNKHENEKGVIHTGNSTISKYLQDNIKSNRLLVRYGDVFNDTIIKEHIKSNKPTILVSSSLAEGVDLKDDLSRFQIIVKLPFLNLSDKRVAKKNQINNEWYVVQMLKTLIQQCGRSTRNSNDYSVTYVLDSSFKWFINKYKFKGWLTKQFLQRIKW